MALNDSAKTTNLKKSIDLYLHTNLKTTEGLDVDFEGFPFDDTEVKEWIQPRTYIPTNTFYTGGSSTQYAEELNIMLNINIFTKKSEVTNTLRHYEIRDMVASHFKVKQDIPVYDFNSSGVTTIQLDKIRIRNIANDMSILESQTLYQYLLAFDMSYTRLTNKV